ncbi:hypothetical protein X760_06815 [Mesorhizobium sp. LSHC422A00]|nr:hypothetical protein X760_06815 [Mesorhizobium sp. LSHC422A00]
MAKHFSDGLGCQKQVLSLPMRGNANALSDLEVCLELLKRALGYPEKLLIGASVVSAIAFRDVCRDRGC